MSVINKMLKDLDQRQQGHQLSNIAQHQVQYLGRKHSVNIWVSISLMSLLIGGVGVYGYQLISQMPVEPAPKFAAASETEVAIIPTVPEINAEAETITSEAVNVTEPLALSKKTVVKASNGLVNTEMPLDEGSHPVAKQNAQIEATVTANAQSEPQTIVTEEDEIVEAIQASAPEREFVKSSVDTPTIEPVKPAGKMAVTEVKLTPSQLAQKQLTLATDAEKQENSIRHSNIMKRPSALTQAYIMCVSSLRHCTMAKDGSITPNKCCSKPYCYTLKNLSFTCY